MIFGKILKGIGGAVKGFIGGGPIGAITGGISGLVGGGGPSIAQRPPGRFAQTVGIQQRVGSRTGFDVGFQLPPFTERPAVRGRFTTMTGVQAGTQVTRTTGRGRSALPMVGEIGVTPVSMAVPTRRCPTGQVLALDGLCYPRSMVPQRFRMWPHKRPPLTVGDRNAIRRAASVKKRLVGLTRDAGAHASLTRPRKQLASGKKR